MRKMRKGKRKPLNKRMLKENLQLGALTLPVVILLLIFSYWPMFGIIIAFKNYKATKGIFGSPWCEPLFKNFIFSVKISIPLENTGVSSVFATSVWPFSLIFSLARRNEGNFFQAVPTTLSSSLAEVRLASLVAWA